MKCTDIGGVLGEPNTVTLEFEGEDCRQVVYMSKGAARRLCIDLMHEFDIKPETTENRGTMQISISCDICNTAVEGTEFDEIKDDLREHLDRHAQGHIELCDRCGGPVDVTHRNSASGAGGAPIHKDCPERWLMEDAEL